MATTRTGTFRAIRLFFLSVAVFVGAAVVAQASPLTLNFSGNVDLSTSGGAASNPFSGFFTWDPAATPFQTDLPEDALYDIVAYQLIYDGVDITNPAAGAAGLFVFNDADAFGRAPSMA